MKTALVIGSTGLIGSQLVDILLESEHYQKVIIFAKQRIRKITSQTRATHYQFQCTRDLSTFSERR